MALSNSTILFIVELVIYLILLPLLVYLAWRHGKPGLLGFFYLTIFATLRIVSDIIFITQRNDKTPSLSASIISSIGLSPLLLALAGLIHEEHVYLVIATQTPSRAKQFQTYMWIAQIVFHNGAGAGIVLVIIGTINLINDQKTHPDKVGGDNIKREAGSVILLLVWLTLAAYAVWVMRNITRTSSPVRTSLRLLALCIVIGAGFVGARAMYSVVYAFDHSASLSPVTGSFAVKLILVVGVQLGAMLSWTAGVWRTRDVKNQQHYYQPVTSGRPEERVELIPQQGQEWGGPAAAYNTGPGRV